MKTVCIRLFTSLITLAFILTTTLAENVEEKWVRRYNRPLEHAPEGVPLGVGFAQAKAVAVDGSGNVVVTGRDNHNNYTAKYAAANGALLWEKRYDEGVDSGDEIRAMVVDGSGNVIVTGEFTAKYAAANGALLWALRYDDGKSTVANAMAVDGSGNVVVTGTSLSSSGERGDWELYTAKYAAASGVLLWEKRYNGLAGHSDSAAEEALAVAVDGSGNVVVTGCTIASNGLTDYYTAKYAASNGALLWEKRYDGPAKSGDEPCAVTVDGSGNVVVTGRSSNGYSHGAPGGMLPPGAVYYGTDYYTAKYAAANGAVLWEKRYNGGYNGGRGSNGARAVAVDGSGNVVVTGSISPVDGDSVGGDYYTAKYAATDGALLWEKRYNSLANRNDWADALAVDGSGNVVVTGSSLNVINMDYCTVKYAAGNGALLWEKRYNGPANSRDVIAELNETDGFKRLALTPDGGVVVTGSSAKGEYYNNGFVNYDYEFATVKYGPLPSAPALTVSAASGIFATGATLHGTVNPNGEATTVQFEYGTTTRYGLTASVTLSPNSGTTAQAVSATISGLMPNTTYHYRLSASNSAGASNSGDMTFTTARLVSHVVASSGGAAAGAGLPEDATFFSFTAPDVGVSGGKVLIPGGKKLDAIFDEQGEVLLRDEQMVPVDSAGGAEMGRITRLQVPTGDAVLATLERSSGTTAKNDQVLFTGLQSGTPTPAVRKGQEVPGLPGIQLKSFLSVDGNGETTFFSGKLRGAGVTGANDMAIFAVGPDGFRLLVRTGMTVEDQPVKSIATLLGEAKTLSEGRWRSGESLGVRLSFQDKKQGLYLISGNASGPEDWLRITRTDDDAGPDLPGAKLEKFNFPAYGPGAAVVDALLRISEGGITKQDKSVVFEALGMETKDLISLQWLAQSSAQVPSPTADEVTGSAVTRLHTVLAGFGRASTVIADVTLPEERKAQTTIFDARPDGTLRQIARIGGAAPGGGRWASFKSVAKPDGNGYGALILGELAVDKAEGITSDKRTALFAVDSQGNLLRILRSGDEIEFGGPGSEFKTVKSFTALTGAAGSIGAARGYDSEGRVAVLVSFTDRTQAAVVIQVP